jgi:hypothetical protein
MAKRKRTDNAMTKRKRTDKTMAKRNILDLFVSELLQVGSFLWTLRIAASIKLTATI